MPEESGAASALVVVDRGGFGEGQGGKTAIGITLVHESHARRIRIAKRSSQLPFGPRDVVFETTNGVGRRVAVLCLMRLDGERRVGPR